MRRHASGVLRRCHVALGARALPRRSLAGCIAAASLLCSVVPPLPPSSLFSCIWGSWIGLLVCLDLTRCVYAAFSYCVFFVLLVPKFGFPMYGSLQALLPRLEQTRDF